MRIAGGALRSCMSEPLLVPCIRGPGVSLDQDLTIGRHAGLRVTGGILELQLQSHYLLDAFVAKVSVLGRERRFRIDARNDSLEWLIRIRIEINACRLVQFDFANLTFRQKPAEINLVQIEQCDDGCSGGDDFTGFGSSRNNRAAERSSDFEILTVCLCFG